ncbi:MAG: short chain dehydrogenase [Pelagibacteraceae bacterium]|nr:short chain dehydrogenase [Pelagibacteraceae bacterium]|tara:strand:- start:2928 stop:3707 length:780 start_codon:yes stop_codon:yes gene_type:complete
MNFNGLFNLENKVVFITGGGRGIGQSMATGFMECGANVSICDQNTEGVNETKSILKEKFGDKKKFEGLEVDVRNQNEIRNAIQITENNIGPIDIAINCAGIANANPAETLSKDQWQNMFDINLSGLFYSCQEEAKAMITRKKGSIINIASMSGSIVNRGLKQVHYNSSKAGVIHLTKSLAMEWVDYGIRVNSISPGYTKTPMNLRPEMVDQVKIFENETPMKRMASPDEIVGPAIFLATDASSFCTGIDLVVDGGFVCW